MIFPSYIFLLVFFPIVMALWYGLPGHRPRLLALTLASYVFYGWWDWRFVGLMLASTALDYIAGARIHRASATKARRRWLWVSMVGNLGALAVFKYYDFFALSARAAGSALGFELPLPLLNAILPVGISFYTFQSMSYSIDIYRGQCRPTAGFLEFAAYVAMFPQLVAGPIVRYAEVERQIADLPHRKIDYEELADGLWLFTLGLLKKVWIADLVAPFANRAFDGHVEPGLYTAWVGVLAYTFQLYFDFSGYSDMARGLGKLLGFEFPVNFNAPYRSANPSEFWNRWHISLSHWLRDYLFIPLGGSRVGQLRTLRNLVIVMFLGGLWHGANWTFVVWGLWHGLLLVVHAVWRRVAPFALPRPLSVALTFVAVMMGWVVFRAASLDDAGTVFAGLFGFNGIEPLGFVSDRYEQHLGPVTLGTWRGISIAGLIAMAVAPALAFFGPTSERIARPRVGIAGVLVGLAIFATLLRLQIPTPFLYFQF